MALTLDIKTNAFLREIFAEGWRTGRQEAWQQGYIKGARRLLRLQLAYRFGSLPGWAEWQLDTADMATLEQWGVRLLAAASLEDVFYLLP